MILFFFSNLQNKFEECERLDEAVTFNQLCLSLIWLYNKIQVLIACHLVCWSLLRSEVTFLPTATTYISEEHLCLDKISVKIGAKLLVEKAAVCVCGKSGIVL